MTQRRWTATASPVGCGSWPLRTLLSWLFMRFGNPNTSLSTRSWWSLATSLFNPALRNRQTNAAGAQYLGGLALDVLRSTKLRSFRMHGSVNGDCGNEVDALLPHPLGGLGVQETAVLDRV